MADPDPDPDRRSLALRSHAARGPDRYEFETAAGTAVVGADEIRPAELALLAGVEPAPDDAVLVVDGNYGVPGVVLGALSPRGPTTVTETSARCAGLVEHNAAANGVELAVELVADVAAVDPPAGGYDHAALAPRPYDPVDVVAQRAAEALTALAPDGVLTLAGPDGTGVGRVADRLAELGTVGDTEAAGVPLYRVTRPADVEVPAWEPERRLTATVRGVESTLVTRPGLFSAGGLDDGSRLLLETLLDRGLPADGDRVLDLCAGYGAVGTTLAGASEVRPVLTDDDRRATACAEATLVASDREGVVRCADGTTAVTGPFDLVATNPPTHAGRSVTAALFRGARAVLDTDGVLAVVANETMGYPARLRERFDAVTVARRAAGYEVVLAGAGPDPEGTA